ncbi:unnamed protein product [Leptidea sinapis]|uniref:Androgen-dependent TFPI-regulating protein n=1 Tax=Leptidea sinapis TaxID=189913 RepID=A0A5E4QEX0_9NEOP|nr:unnamed protein product [Leptidea sinapis]
MLINTARSSESLLKLRLWFYGLADLHLIIVGGYLLSIDMSKDENPAVREYMYTRWRLITIWFNLISLFYFPICFYCDWKELKGQWDQPRVRILRQIKDVVMTSILLPTTLYSDYLFWRVWNKDPGLIGPVAVFVYLPTWAHHSLHTVSAVVIIMDLLLVPRQRPESLLPGLALSTAFVSAYTIMVTYNYMHGIAVYSILNIFNTPKKVLLIILAYIEHYFFYTVQWWVLDWVRGDLHHAKEKIY